MKRTWMHRIAGTALGLFTALSVCVSPLTAGNVLAADLTVTQESKAADEIGELKLVYGNEELADEDAIVMMIFGDGYTADEQDSFYAYAEKTAKYIMGVSPWDEFTDEVKFYALGTVSNESGARGDEADSFAEFEKDKRDTYFGTHFWTSGMERLVDISSDGKAKIKSLQEAYKPEADYCVVVVNAEKYGGSGGTYCTASMNASALEIMVHELGHSVADLADEYWAEGYEDEYPNMTSESDPEKIKWSRFIGMDGIGVYPYSDGGENGASWYHPSLNCKMQYLGETHPFCEVCKEALRKSLCEATDVSKLFFQTYADEFIEGTEAQTCRYGDVNCDDKVTADDALAILKHVVKLSVLGDAGSISMTLGDIDHDGKISANDALRVLQVVVRLRAEESYAINPFDMSRYFMIRRGASESLGNLLGGALTLTYYDADGNELEAAPVTAGDYKVKAVYAGGDTYDACEQTGAYTIEKLPVTLNVESKVYDGEAVALSYEIGYEESEYSEEECTVAVSYSGTLPSYYSTYSKKYYDSSEAPVQPGSYTATLTVYDAKGSPLVSKSVGFEIAFRTLPLAYNNDSAYSGANEAYNIKTVVLVGEGFTADEQDEFEALAKQYVSYIQNTEPFRETKLYINFISVDTISDESGVGVGAAKDTYFQTYLDESGAITTGRYSSYFASLIAYYEVTPYRNAEIIIVNDDNVKENYCELTGNYAGAIYVGKDEAGMEFAAQELLNHFTGEEAGYRAGTDEEKEAQRAALLEMLYYQGDDYDTGVIYSYPIITSRESDLLFEATGEPVDLSPYFHIYLEDGIEPTYVAGYKDDGSYEYIDTVSDAFAMRYFRVNEDGTAGEELAGAPSEPGTYIARAELGGVYLYVYSYETESYGTPVWVDSARGEVTFTIKKTL